jgi:hypothetical protein
MFNRNVFKKSQGFDIFFFYRSSLERIWMPKDSKQKQILNLTIIDIPEDKFCELSEVWQ